VTWKERQIRSRRFWSSLTPLATVQFFLGVFFLFACIAFVQAPRQGPVGPIFASAGLSGAIAVVFGFLGTRAYYKTLILAAVLAFVVLPAFVHWVSPPNGPAGPGISFGAIGAIICIITGYTLMLLFIGTQGRRHARLQAEVDLAAQIHRALAPAVEQRVGGFEFCGESKPSGVMGGDLLDLVAHGDDWLCYVADVAGHGVAAGVVMGVVKSAARTWLMTGARQDGEGMLPSLNRVLGAMLPPESYVTFAALRSTSGAALRFAAAGHPPLLHFHAGDGSVSRHGLENFPLGMFPEAEFTAGQFDCAPGDVLALFTDGLTDIEDAHGRDFGLEGLESALLAGARRPLAEARAGVLAAARAFGPQSDDQTLLLIRRLA
jgi:hypothetical protein